MPVIKTTKTIRRYSFRREVCYTHLHVFYSAVGASSAQTPSIADAVGYALDRVHNVVGVVDWVKLAGMPASAFGVPSFLACGQRFQTTMSLAPSVDAALTDFVEAIAPEFTALKKRKPYRPFAVALLFRAVIAEELGKLPYKVAGDDAPEDAPAAFDPKELLYPNGTNAPLPEELPEDVLDPEIFDRAERARAAADAVTAETGLF